MEDRTIRAGFIAAGLTNILGVAFFSLGFTNPLLGELYPGVFSGFGLIVIMLWGAAYIAAAPAIRSAPWLALVFALEKLLYAGSWVLWLARHGNLGALFARSKVTALFFAIYGPLDLAFGIFFLAAFLSSRSLVPDPPRP